MNKQEVLEEIKLNNGEAKTLEAVHTHTHTHTLCLPNK